MYVHFAPRHCAVAEQEQVARRRLVVVRVEPRRGGGLVQRLSQVGGSLQRQRVAIRQQRVDVLGRVGNIRLAPPM